MKPASKMARMMFPVVVCLLPLTLHSQTSNCPSTGKIQREFWHNIPGVEISSIPVNTPPSSVTDLNNFATGQYAGNNYGSRIRGYVCPPLSGEYIFWISSDDRSELWLSTDDKPDSKRKIAYVDGYTSPLQYTKYASQRSEQIHLEANTLYYIEVLHKEAGGNDHITVGWRLPNADYEMPMPGHRLIPYTVPANQPPVVSIRYPRNNYIDEVMLTVKADASDPDDNLVKVEFYLDGEKMAEDNEPPFEQTFPVEEGNLIITVRAIDAEGLSAEGTLSAINENPYQCYASGNIRRERWFNVAGNSVNDIP